MPASYVHQSVAAHAADALSLFPSDAERSALLAGAEGPDPLFFCFRPGKPFAPVVASLLHTQKTDDFLLALCDACAGDALLRAYCCGFFTHYATDTTFHPFVYAHSLTAAGKYSGNAHCTLEHQLETLHYRREGHAVGLPVQMGGFAALDAAQRKKIAAALSAALARVFPDSVLSPARLEKCFSDAVGLCRFLRSEDGKRYRTLGGVLSPFKLDETLHAHMMPAEPPQADIANDAHAPWTSIWTPDEVRHDSFGDLFAASVARAEALAAQLLKETQEKPAKKPAGVDYLGECARHLEQVLGRKVRMTQGRKTGRIELEYYDADDREALLQALEGIGRRN